MPPTWVVTISSDRPVSQIQQDLAAAGCSVKNILAEIGVIIADCDSNAVQAVRQISGVVDVSPDQTINLGPPDSPVTW